MPAAIKKERLLHHSLFAVLALVAAPAGAADWGYDDPSKFAKPAAAKAAHPAAAKTKPAAPGTARGAKPAKAGSKPAPGGETVFGANTPARQEQIAVSDWLEIYELVSKQPLTDEQRTSFRTQLQHKLGTPRKSEVTSVLAFWPQARKQMADNPEMTEYFSKLFRALLRFQSKASNLAPEDSHIIAEVLGPERVAAPGTPPLTEEAIDAYGDMACFMYEQRHPGKTIDATDNRAIFATKTVDMYNHAPSEKAKKSMANFALSWAKFRIAWAGAGSHEREQLLSSLESGTKPSDDLMNETANLVINKGPWAQSKI